MLAPSIKHFSIAFPQIADFLNARPEGLFAKQ